MKKKVKKKKRRLRTRHMPTRVHIKEDKKVYRRKKKHKRVIEE